MAVFRGLCLILWLLLGNLYAQDWAKLDHYRMENAALSAPSADTPRVVFMGNSITEGWEQSRSDFFSDHGYINRGISGQTTPQMLLRFRQDVIALQPRAVVILAGINDIAGNTGPSTLEMIADNIFSMAELAEAHDIRVVLCAVLPAMDFPWRRGMQPAEKVVKLNQMIAAYAETHGHVYVDYFTPMATPDNGLRKDLGQDGVHPNLKGYQIMEPLVQKGIAAALQE